LHPEAHEDLRWFRKGEKTLILEEIATQLTQEPMVETRNRKRLRPDHLTEWELRIRHFRVFYDVDVEASLVKVVAIGYKRRTKLFFRGQEFVP
jgi:mRNA-degrading endonuclease RelE of RelBE toxin-antitoxin system